MSDSCTTTQAKSPRLPPTRQVIISVAYHDRYAILSDGSPNGAVIGSHYEGNPNELWTFVSKGNKTYKISTKDENGNQALAQTSDPSVGDTVYVSALGSIYTVAPSDAGNSTIRISSSSGDLYWTLENSNEGTPVTLQKNINDSTQIWKIASPPA